MMGGHGGSKGEFQEEEDNKLTVTDGLRNQ